MKKIQKIIIGISSVATAFLLSGCDETNNFLKATDSANETNYITDIELSTTDNVTSLVATYLNGETKEFTISDKAITDISFSYEENKLICHKTYSDGTSQDSEVNNSIIEVSKSAHDNGTDLVTITLGDGSVYTYYLPKKSVTNIIKQGTDENKTYTINYSDGTTSSITIQDGKDGENGKDGQDVTISNIFETCVEQGIYEENEFEKFLTDYLTITDNNTQRVTNKAIQSCVTVYSEHQWLTTSRFSSNQNSAVSCGAGVIYKMDTEENGYSYIITNYHVVYDATAGIAQKIRLFQYGTSEYVYKSDEVDENGYPVYEYGDGSIEGEYIGGSLNCDIALIKVKTSDLIAHNPYACPVEIADNYNLADKAIAIGNPEGDGFSATIGHVSRSSENIDMTGADNSTQVRFRVLRIDTAVNGGNSGGGLFNQNGELIGIVNAKALTSSSGTTLDNMSYALPVDFVTNVADNLLYYYNQNLLDDSIEDKTATVKKLMLGIQYQSVEGSQEYDSVSGKISLSDKLKVVSVTNTFDETLNRYPIGYILGLQENDIITAITINDVEYNFSLAYEFADLLLTIRVGDTVKISGIRSDNSLFDSTTLTIEENHLTKIA